MEPKNQLELSKMAESFIKRLSELRDYCVDNALSESEFSVSIADAKDLGCTELDLRLLIHGDKLVHLVEQFDCNSTERVFVQPIARFRFVRESCFVLPNDSFVSKPNVHVPITKEPNSPQPIPKRLIPVWDLKTRRLVYQGILIKHFRVPAPNQEAVLSAFQEEEWSVRILDPLSPVEGMEPQQRLHDTIRSLNRNQVHHLLLFRGDGNGQGVTWEVLPNDRIAE